MLKIWLTPFWEVARLRRGPQDIPHSVFLLCVVLLLHMLVDVLIMTPDVPIALSLLRAVLDVAFIALFVYVVLQVPKKLSRWVQSLTALVGAQVIIGVFGMVLTFIYHQANELALLVSLMLLGLVAWNVLIAAHVIRHAVDVPIVWGIVLGVVYLMLTYNLINGLAPVPER